jgi:hypothetical protein
LLDIPRGGSHAPQFRQPGRQAGALSIQQAKPRADSKGKGKGKANQDGKGDKIWDLPKSREIKRLEGLKDKLTSLQNGEKVKREDRDLDCFCQGASGSPAHRSREGDDADEQLGSTRCRLIHLNVPVVG